MRSVPIHLIFSEDRALVRDDLKTAFLPLNGAFQLRLIQNKAQLEAQILEGIHVAIFVSGTDELSWQEYSRLLRGNTDSLVFILVSNIETTSSAITQGANLLIRENEIHELPLILASLLVKKKNTNESDAEIADYTIPNIGEDEISELHKKNEELEKINFELDRFVYSASHDLRAPLTSVMGLLYLLREEEKVEGSLRLIGLMEESINKLDNTIRDIVAYSRNNRTELIIEPLRIQPIIDGVISGLRYLESSEYNLQESVISKDEGVFLGDKSRLTIILNNLISNAFRFKHPARLPEIIVKVHIIGPELEITVSDNGIGINEHHLDKIFNMFYRTSDHSAGSGLGLYIVRETVKKMKGSIEVKSTVNQGTTFRISLPLQWNNIIKS
jgi:signal transduction histidine kinase